MTAEPNRLRLSGKVSIVMGAAHGIGQVFSYALAEEGCRVVIADIDEDAAQNAAKRIQEKGYEALAVKTHASNETETIDLARGRHVALR
jgi:3-oxoacyl-[acyl-carrier protein] reductase